MRILIVCAELAPWAKTGGLADSVAGMSEALAANGHDVRVLLPRYTHLPAPRATRALEHRLGTGSPLRVGELEQTAEHASRARPRVFLVDLGELTGTSIYTGDAADAGRFLRLSAAAVALSAADDWQPEVIHCHDWHAALVPVLQRLEPRKVAPAMLTLHNVGYQGVFTDQALAEQHGFAALQPALPADARAGGSTNFLRAGIRTAARVTTVSPTYAEEIRGPDLGMGLEDALRAHGRGLLGILNGVDYSVWSPERDPFLPERYSAANLEPKRRIKNGLLARLKLASGEHDPLVGIVSRLAEQKGIDLFAAALPRLLEETRASFVVLGSGDDIVAAALRALADAHRDRVEFVEGHDEAFAHEILAGSDLTIVPSRYEPCGLTQLYALRYGTIPVVRATGGLVDTIEHFDPATGKGVGSVFRDADPQGVLWGVRTALAWYADGATWARVVANAMAADFSWPKQVPLYEELYRSLL